MDGYLPANLTVAPLSRISPSRFAGLLDCALREVWAANKNPLLLPASPAAHLGTVAHKLMEFAGSGRLAGASRAQIEAKWDQLIDETETRMSANWIERINVPLRQTAWRYSVQRIRAAKRALELASKPEGARLPSSTTGERLSERWLELPDGSVGGYIDRIDHKADGTVIRDYKTGIVTDETESGIRESYAVQLKLYAALYHARYERWPTELQLVPLRGDEVNVPFSEVECGALLEEAKRARTETNASIAAGQLQQLASPAPATCRYCGYRPYCSAYRVARQNANPLDGWPHDLQGTLLSIDKSDDGRFSLLIESGRSSDGAITVNRLAESPDRHPALVDAHNGDQLSCFNLRPTESPTIFTEAAATTLYRD